MTTHQQAGRPNGCISVSEQALTFAGQLKRWSALLQVFTLHTFPAFVILTSRRTKAMPTYKQNACGVLDFKLQQSKCPCALMLSQFLEAQLLERLTRQLEQSLPRRRVFTPASSPRSQGALVAWANEAFDRRSLWRGIRQRFGQMSQSSDACAGLSGSASLVKWYELYITSPEQVLAEQSPRLGCCCFSHHLLLLSVLQVRQCPTFRISNPHKSLEHF